MTYERFEDTPVWQAVIALAHSVFDLVRERGFAPLGDLRNQLQRASLSISNNIAEGFERGTTSELLTFLYIARGSAGEVRSALRFAESRSELSRFKERIADLIPKAEAVSRQLRGWAASLQNGDIQGQRRLNSQTQEEYQQRRRTEGFLGKLQQIRDGGGPK